MKWTQIDSCWAQTAAAVRRGDAKLYPQQCHSHASELLQLAAFLHLCRRYGFLPVLSPGKTLHDARSRLPASLFDPSPINSDAWKRAFSSTSQIDGPPEILAEIHRRLLGRKLIDDGRGGFKTASDSRTAKSGGVFYTPADVAKYIAEGAIAAFYGNVDHRRHPSTASADRVIPAVLDPACGCGVFLLAAFRALCLRLQSGGDRVDSVGDILRRIHGVDVDAQAVLVARRCLWVEMMTARRASPAHSTRGVQDVGGDFLADTIRIGDSLCDDFPSVHSNWPKSFDMIVGNPPYRRELGTKALLDRVAATRLGRRWRTARMDLWYYFVHRGLELLSDGGVVGFIVSGYWTSGAGAAKLLEQLRSEAHVEEIFDLGRLGVFQNVAGRHMIIRIGKNHRDRPTLIKRVDCVPAADGKQNRLADYLDDPTRLTVYEKTPEQLFRDGRIDLEPPDDDLFAAFSRTEPLGGLGKIRQGIAENPASINLRTNLKHGGRWRVGEGVFSLAHEEAESLALSRRELNLLRPYHCLCDLGRYRIAAHPSRFLIYSTADTWSEFASHPALGEHLQRFRPLMEVRRETRQGLRPWWQLHWPREADLWRSAKIVCLQMAARPAFVPAGVETYVPFSANVFVPAPDVREHLYYFAALLNSRLLWRWFARRAKRRGVGLEINGRVLRESPIRRIDFTNAADRRRHDRLVDLVKIALAASSNSSAPAAETDREIDAVVDDLYGLRS